MFCCKFMVIFRDFPCNNALLWVGNIMTPEKNRIRMMPRTGLLLGNVNGSQCIIWDDPAIQVPWDQWFAIWKAGKNVACQNNSDIQSCSFYMRGIYQVFCKLQGIITWPHWKTLVERMEHVIEFIAVEECCGNSMKFLKMLYIYQMCLFLSWCLHTNVPVQIH